MKRVFALLGLCGVVLGAFGSHYLKGRMSSDHMMVWHTATFYLFVHVLAGLLSIFLACKRWSSYCFAGGTLLFSGSLYALAFSGVKLWGAITPVGGVLFLLGWLFLLF